ncbi:MAG: hypothetical protein IAE83_16375 [Anaerolinea sp.]|nr:hypothetical protein [Anaerolinea sp.]MCC6974861.1 hypothetical protein [Anaerolineae bacterium]CAG0972572.1 hypothetical protein ANRL4_01356 [Anaerolineae bacterium]
MPLAEVRVFLPIDLPLIHRLTPRGISFDSLTALTKGIHTIEGAVWSALPIADLGTPTFVLREGDLGYIAQFRHKTGDQNAHIVFIAPEISGRGSEDNWMRLLNAMIIGAGRRGAFTLNAEISEESDAYELLRRVGFATYSRQVIWQRQPRPPAPDAPKLLRPATELDAIGVNSLYYQTVPHIVRQIDPLPDLRHGAVWERGGRIEAFVSGQEGKYGIYVTALIHPDLNVQAASEVIESALASLPRVDKLPVYMCVRRYQEWLFTALENTRFSPYANQAVMAKHTSRRIEDCAYKPALAFEGTPLKLNKIIEYYHDRSEPPVGISHHG